MSENYSIRFFDDQFRKQVAATDFALNPFEQAVLPYVSGRVLDLGCGLGNLSIDAARRGAQVLAVDASETAIKRIADVAASERLELTAALADMRSYEIAGVFDTIVAIGLLMFFPRDRALALLADIRAHVAPRGLAIVNVLIEGTTYMGMFEPGQYYLFGRDELEAAFAGWEILRSTHATFAAPGDTVKVFSTVIARKAGAD